MNKEKLRSDFTGNLIMNNAMENLLRRYHASEEARFAHLRNPDRARTRLWITTVVLVILSLYGAAVYFWGRP